MPGSTPNRGYPYPLDSESIQVPTDIFNLAAAADVDVESVVDALASETAARTTADDYINAVRLRATVGGGLQTDKIAIDAGHEIATLDMYAVHVLHFNLTFAIPPICVVSTSASTLATLVGVESVTTTTANVYGRRLADGEPAFFEAVSYYWMALSILP